ncbi:MAG: imidazolonepropionase [Anaerolineae bacterium]|nr:imidazolonepropionase [Anaerolineae bacterium]
MTRHIDLLIHNIGQLCTLRGGPQRGDQLGALGIIEHGAVAIDDGKIFDVGTSEQLHLRYDAARLIDAQGCAVVPGLVDPHTHLVWAGDRAAEFEMRLAGATYMEIMNAGGGINNTVQQVRAASLEQLIAETRPRLDRMLRLGTTTVEIKTGYGLDTPTELKQLEAIYRLAQSHPMTIVATFMGAHAIPPEFAGRTEAYVDYVVSEMIPAVAAFATQRGMPLPFIDVFCEQGVFDVPQTERILRAGIAHGMRAKLHADEFAALGGTRLAVELGAVSVDHLVESTSEDITALGKGDTVAVALPGTPFGLAHSKYTPARAIIAAGGILAIATDCNPGTAWCESIPFIMALSCRMMGLTPAQALAAATINAACALGLADTHGSIEVGKQADLLILDAQDYRHLAYRFGGSSVKSVIKSGVVI